MNIPQLPSEAVSVAAALCIASVVIAALGLIAARIGGRSAPLSHGLLLSTLLVLLTLPAAPFAAALINVEWLPKYRFLESDPGAAGSAGALPRTANASPATLSADEIPDGAILPGHSTSASGSAGAANAQHSLSGGSLRSTPAIPAGSLQRPAADSWRLNSETVGLVALGIVALWILGSLISVIRTLRSGFAVAQVVRHATPVANQSSLALLDELTRSIGIRRRPQLRASVAVRVPFAWGLARSLVVLPQQLVEAAEEDSLRPILLHELAHIRRRDAWIGVVQRIVAAMYWWNPLIHRLNAQLGDAREQICDAHVLSGGCGSREYAELLVELASQVTLPQPAATLGLLSRSQPQLTRRVQHLLEDKPMSTSLRSFAKISMLGLLIVLTTSGLLVAYVVVDDALFFTRIHKSRTPTRASKQAHQIADVWRPVARQSATPNVMHVDEPLIAESNPFHDAPAPTPDVAPSIVFSEPSAADSNPFAGALQEPATVAAEPQLDQDAFGVQPGGRSVPAEADAFADEDADVTAPGFSGFGAPPSRARGSRSRPDEFVGGGGFGGGANTRTDDDDEDTPAFTGPRLRGLALIGLSANADGSLKELFWFTESLGSGDEAYAKLAKRLTEFTTAHEQAGGKGSTTSNLMFGEPRYGAGRARGGFRAAGGSFSAGYESHSASGAVFGGMRRPTHLAAQIMASPEIRYAEVQTVIEICQRHVEQIVFGGSLDTTVPYVNLTLGFVRDGGGRKISSSPVLVWRHPVDRAFEATGETEDGVSIATPLQRDEIVTLENLPLQLLNWRQTLSGDAQPDSLSALIRADDGVDSKLVEQVVQATLPAGIERVVLRHLAPPATDEPSPTFQDFNDFNESPDREADTFSDPPADTRDVINQPLPQIEPGVEPAVEPSPENDPVDQPSEATSEFRPV